MGACRNKSSPEGTWAVMPEGDTDSWKRQWVFGQDTSPEQHAWHPGEAFLVRECFIPILNQHSDFAFRSEWTEKGTEKERILVALLPLILPSPSLKLSSFLSWYLSQSSPSYTVPHPSLLHIDLLASRAENHSLAGCCFPLIVAGSQTAPDNVTFPKAVKHLTQPPKTTSYILPHKGNLGLGCEYWNLTTYENISMKIATAKSSHSI